MVRAAAWLVVAVLCLASRVDASLIGPDVDFSAGPVGNLGTYFTTVDGARVDVASSAGAATLYRWDAWTGCAGACVDHNDHGFGVLSPGEAINVAEPEFDPGEWMRVIAPSGFDIVGVWFTSVNNGASGRIYSSPFPSGPNITEWRAGVGAFGAAYEGRVSVLPSSVIWLAPDALTPDNYSLVWGVDLARQPCSSYQPCSVPEPSTLASLVLALGLCVTMWVTRCVLSKSRRRSSARLWSRSARKCGSIARGR